MSKPSIMTIMSIGEITNLLRTQAQMRAQENDEAGVLLEAADEIERRVLALGQAAGECKTCRDFPSERAAQEAFVTERVVDGRYYYEAESCDLVCNECGHAGVWPPEGATAESIF